MKKYIVHVFDFGLVLSLVLPYQFAFAAQVPTPVSCWSFDEASGDAHDAVGTNTLVNQNSMPYTTGHKSGAADVDALNSITDGRYLSIQDSVQQGLNFTHEMSISFWINFDSVIGGQGLVTKFDYDSNNESYSMVYDGTSNQIQFLADADGVGGSLANPSLNAAKVWNFNPTLGTWYHIVVTYNRGDTHLLINGKENNDVVVNNIDNFIYNGTAPFSVGSIPLAVRESNFKIDELGVWDRALAKNEVKKLYNKGNGVSCQDL